MANVKQCDRCSKIYKENKYLKSPFNTLTRVGFKYAWSDGGTGERIDLCDECQAALTKFMKMED